MCKTNLKARHKTIGGTTSENGEQFHWKDEISNCQRNDGGIKLG